MAGHEAPGVPEDVAGLIRQRWKRATAMAAVACLLLAAAFAGGYLVGDDADQVDDLQGQLSEAQRELDDAEATIADLSTETSDLKRDLDEVQTRLSAELGLAGKSTAATGTGPSIVGDLTIGQAGKAGILIFRPTSFERAEAISDGYETTTPDEGTVFYRARITVKNDGQDPVNPFCSGGGHLLDDADRRYDAQSIVGDTANCGDDLQPGAQKDDYEVYFQVPLDAEPATMVLNGDDFSDDAEGATWDVR